MRIAIMGAGGVGGYFGALLAKAGEDVTFIARGEHLKTMKQNGLQIRSPEGDFKIEVKATNDPSDVGPMDLVLFCVKAYDTEEAALQAKPMIADDTTVISLQNGVEKEEILGRILGTEHIMGGLCMVSAFIEAPGVITHHARKMLTFGEMDGRQSTRGKRILEVFKIAGINAIISPAIIKAEWEKFTFICAVSGLCCLTRLPIVTVLQFKEIKQLYIDSMKEVIQVARNRGVDLDQDELIERFLNIPKGASPDIKPSMLRDLENGKQIEVEPLHGAVVRFGRALEVPTPINEVIYACLKVVNEENRGRS
ncbi:MAG: 2-dehydropantoate 2-reductase [Candidatus Heimdallarchaeota archaeon]